MRARAIAAVMVLSGAGGGTGCDTVSSALYAEGGRRQDAAREALSELRMRQEAYRAEHGQYSDVTGDTAWLPATAPPSDGTAPWTPTPATAALGFGPDSTAVPWQIQAFAGFPGTAMPPPGATSATPGSTPMDDFWFIARARGHFRSADRVDVLEQRSDQPEPVLLEAAP